MVEKCISSLGIDPALCRGEKPGQYSLVKGSAKVWIDVWNIEREGRAYFQVMSPFMKIPDTNREQFYEELLTINDKLYGVAFTIYNNWAWLKHIREVEGLDETEVTATIHRIGNYADDYDDKLIAKYGQTSGDPIGAGQPAPPG